MKSTIEAIKTALQNEQKSVELYTKAAESTKNLVVKKTMLFLANWEKSHIELIQKLNANLMGEIQILDIKTECSKDALCVIKEFFGKNIDEFNKKLKGNPSDLKVYETGMKIELAGYNFYKNTASETDDKEARQLFDFLAGQENAHYKFLEDQYSYLKDPKSWFLNEEKWILEG